jgi:hypothetical protein
MSRKKKKKNYYVDDLFCPKNCSFEDFCKHIGFIKLVQIDGDRFIFSEGAKYIVLSESELHEKYGEARSTLFRYKVNARLPEIVIPPSRQEYFINKLNDIVSSSTNKKPRLP